jgi:hypothetical protein
MFMNTLTFREEKYGFLLEGTDDRPPGPGLLGALSGGVIGKALKSWEEAYLPV